MFWPGYLPDEFEYLRVVDYLVGGERGGRGGGGEGEGATKDTSSLQLSDHLKIFSCRTRSITEKIASSFIKAVYLLRSTRRLLPKNLLAVRNYRI